MSRELTTPLYRVVQEALRNVLRHAEATLISVILEYQPDHVAVIIEDDGKGFDAEARPKTPRLSGGLGILGMEERIALVGGTFKVESTPGHGTAVYVRVPTFVLEEDGG